MPDSTLQSPVQIPANTGVWSGPAYAGGAINLPANEFVSAFNVVKPISFLDAVAQKHDMIYEYASRVYGADDSKNNPNFAAKNMVKFLTDLDMIESKGLVSN